MDENAIHQWLIECFGPAQGNMAFQQLSSLPDAVKDQIFNQDPDRLPKPSEVQALMQAFTSNGLNTLSDIGDNAEHGPINVKLASSIALAKANDESSERTVSAAQGQAVRQAMSEANLWLDTACSLDPAPGEPGVFTRADWVNATLDSWAKFASPVEQSISDALTNVITDRFGDGFVEDGATQLFAGPIPIEIPENMKNPASLIRLIGNMAYSMQLGHAAGELSHQVRGSFDQGIALQQNPAGALIAQNATEYAKSLQIDESEVLSFLALGEVAHARLFAQVPWLMPRFEALIGKYSRGVDIDLDAVEEQLRDATSMDPESISGAVDLSKVGIPDTPEQQEAIASLETLLALVEGWVDCVTWQAGMAHLPHIDQLREMMRRERAVGGAAEQTFGNLLGMHLQPKRMREAAAEWERIGNTQGYEARDAKWSHPDLLPTIPDQTAGTADVQPEASATDDSTQADTTFNAPTTNQPMSSVDPGTIDWDAELSKLLNETDGNGNGNTDGHPDSATGSPDTDPGDEKPSDAKDGSDHQ
jgi:putative hydrolase